MTSEGVHEQETQPISRAEIDNNTIKQDGVRVVLHWVYQGEYTDDAIDIDALIKRDGGDEEEQATVEDVERVVQRVEEIAAEHNVNRITAPVATDDDVMRSMGFKETFGLATLNVFSNTSVWVKRLDG